MKTTSFLVASALAAALSLPAVARAGPLPRNPSSRRRSAMGSPRPGKNDCQTANSSCAGTSKKDSQGDAWDSMCPRAPVTGSWVAAPSPKSSGRSSAADEGA